MHRNNLPDVLARWSLRDGDERQRSRTEQSFCVPKADIAAQGYDLSLNRYKEVVHEAVEHLPPKRFLPSWLRWRLRFRLGMKELEGMLK